MSGGWFAVLRSWDCPRKPEAETRRLRKEFDAIDLNGVAVHVEFAGHFDLFADVMFGLVLVAEFIADLGHRILENEIAIFLGDAAGKCFGFMGGGVA